jgi:hypothetical protein
MAKPLPLGTDRRTLADQYVTDFSVYIKDLCPGADLEISFVRYEEEDAHIRVFPPDSLSEEERETLDAQIAERSIDILLETGLLILAGVYEPHQRGKW